MKEGYTYDLYTAHEHEHEHEYMDWEEKENEKRLAVGITQSIVAVDRGLAGDLT